MELHLHPGDEFLSSLEPESLQVMAYAKLCAAKTQSLEIKTSCIPMQFPKERPPFLRRGGATVAMGADDIITYLQEQRADPESKLSASQQSELSAYSALLVDRLLPAFLYLKWLNAQNYVDYTRASYGKIFHFPLTLFYLSWQHRVVRHLIMRGAPPDLTPEQRGFELVSKAEECIGLISARLGEKEYFCGDCPTVLDAVMFGYLEALLQSPHSNNDPLSAKINSLTNLVTFCQRIRKKFFPEKRTKSVTPSAGTTVSTPASLWRDSALWISVGVATFVLCVQGVRVGLFRHFSGWVAARKPITRGDSDS